MSGLLKSELPFFLILLLFKGVRGYTLETLASPIKAPMPPPVESCEKRTWF